MGNLTIDAAGNLYGTTYAGGISPRFCTPYGLPHGCGVVFKLAPTPSGWSETVLHEFLGVGANPAAPVIFDKQGSL